MNRLLLTCYCFLMGLILFMANTDNSRSSMKNKLQLNSGETARAATAPVLSIQLAQTDSSITRLVNPN